MVTHAQGWCIMGTYMSMCTQGVDSVGQVVGSNHSVDSTRLLQSNSPFVPANDTQSTATPPSQLTWLLAPQCCLHLCCSTLLGPRVAAQLIQQEP
jgi:hypothetical protein